MTGESPVLEARDISLNFGGVRALGQVGFGVVRGFPLDIPDRLIVPDRDRKIADEPHTATINDPEVERAYLGEDDGEPSAAGTVAEAGAKLAGWR